MKVNWPGTVRECATSLKFLRTWCCIGARVVNDRRWRTDRPDHKNIALDRHS
jgi:hypothetical protein